MVHESYWEHLNKGIPKTRPTSHPFAAYFSSRVESFHNQRHRSLGVGKTSFSKERTSFWKNHKMFVAQIMRRIIPQHTLHGQWCMQEMLSASFLQGNNIKRRRLSYLSSTKQWSNVSKDSKWLCIRQPMGGAPQPLPYQDVQCTY